MTDVTSTTPSTTETPTPVAAPETSQPTTVRPDRPSPETSARMNRALRGENGLKAQRPSREAAKDVSTEAPKGESPTDETTTDEPKAYTKEEIARLIQSEADRREAKRNADAKAQAKREQERQLRRSSDYSDLLTYAQLKEQEETEQSVEAQTAAERAKVAESLTTTYDRAVLDPIFLALSKEDQNALLKENGHLTGLESRAAMTKGALKALEKQFKAEGAREAEERLRSNPAFRKQILRDLRGTRDEPAVVTGAPRGAPASDMNSWIRGRHI